jgi:hypothetical protein
LTNITAGITFRASAPNSVSVGEQFRIEYTANTQDVSNLHVPPMPGFDILMGPSSSVQSSFQIINGHTSQSSSITYTFVLRASRAGSYSIPGATITAKGRAIRSNSVRINVSSSGRSAGGRQNGANQQIGVREQRSGSHITGKDLFITVTASKRRCYEQEGVLLTYKVYSLVNLTQLEGKMPDMQGFHTQEITLPQQKSYRMERHNGRNYGTVVLREYVIFPQQTGKLVVPSIKFNGIVQQRNESVDPIDAFFNGGSDVVEVQKTIVAPSITLQVDPLPTRPSNFSGGVGDFTLSSSVNTKKLKTNDALNLRIVLSGVGNLKLVKTPQVKFPGDFESYDAKVTDKISMTPNGVSGNKIFDYLAIPRHPGKYKIPAVEYTVFDLRTKKYKTLKTEPLEIEVEKGAGDSRQAVADFTGKEDVKLLADDIHYIKLGDVSHKSEDVTFFASIGYLLSYIIPFLLFIVVLVIFRRKAIDNANVAKMRGKKANKVASRRLRAAETLLHKGKQEEFYDEVLHALWGYIGDKLNIAVAELNKDNVVDKLTEINVPNELIDMFMKVLNDCEFARFAPGDKNQAMDNVYITAKEVISKMENSIKR